jgi:acyl-CoA thioesterase-2
MLKARQEFLQSMMDLPLMFQYKPMDPIEYKSLLAYKDESPPAISRPTRHAWVKSDSEAALPDDLRVHQCLLAYISDHGLMTTSLKPHGKSFFHGINPSGFASLDHSMWFHR